MKNLIEHYWWIYPLYLIAALGGIKYLSPILEKVLYGSTKTKRGKLPKFKAVWQIEAYQGDKLMFVSTHDDNWGRDQALVICTEAGQRAFVVDLRSGLSYWVEPPKKEN